MNKEKGVIIACSMLENEVKKSCEDHQLELPIVWLDRGLHEYPQRLRAALQTEIDQQQDKDYIILAFCLCGNSTLDLISPHTQLIIPKFDDCIRMTLALEKGAPPQVCIDCLYFTKGWLDDENSIRVKLDEYVEQYGEKKGKKIIKMLYGGYQGIRLIDLDSYQVADYWQAAAEIAAKLGFNCGVCPGTMRVFDKLFSFDWDEEFCVLSPGEKVTVQHFADRPL